MRRTGTDNRLYTSQRNYEVKQTGRSCQRKSRRRHSRAQVVYLQKCALTAIVILILTALILLGSGIRAFAGSTKNSQDLHTYYTSIELEQGDTLWDIAQEYTFGTGVDAQDYIEEVCTLNHLSNADSVHEGNYIVIPYYSYEDK